MLFRRRLRDLRAGSRAPRGQSLVEFGLVLPVLFFFLLGVADLGRVFADGITMEAAVRNGAEAAALEYQQLCGKTVATDPFCDAGLSQSDYNTLHSLVLDVACREAERLTNRVTTGGGACTNPAIAICIHDNSTGDANSCGAEGTTGNVPAECTHMFPDTAWSPVRSGPAEGRPYVEVRMCYEFNPILPITSIWWGGSVWLQKENNFAVTNY